MKYIIGTRGSNLALVQANMVKDKLQEKYPEDSFEIKVIKTQGDKILDRPLEAIGQKGVFVKEIEKEILENEVQIGVHSMKDMPAEPEEGLIFTKAWKREDPRDAFIINDHIYGKVKGDSFEILKENSVIGTGSKRRGYQFKKLRPDAEIVDIRGNVETRIRKMYEQNLDGIILAAAGLKRLNKEEVVYKYFSTEEMICAPAQGVLAIEIRKDNLELKEKIDSLSDAESDNEAKGERTYLKEIDGDCHLPIAARCERINEKEYKINALFGSVDGNKLEKVMLQGDKPEELGKKAAEVIRKKVAGTVYLIGAGPGDPDLLTVKGAKLLEKADCIIYDRLVSKELLGYAKPNAELVYVGKENKKHTLPQSEINRLLVKKALEHEVIVRLKGGDPYVFGRGGEEGIYLNQHQVKWQVVPGVTSAVAGLAYAGIPITHRGISRGFRVVTAHDKDDKLTNLDFESMVKGQETLVFLMGLSKVKEITDNFILAGMKKDMKAAVVSKATTKEQKVVISDLKNLDKEVKKQEIKSPAIIVVGEVVGLAKELDFITRFSLENEKNIILPKIGENSKLAEELKKNENL